MRTRTLYFFPLLPIGKDACHRHTHAIFFSAHLCAVRARERDEEIEREKERLRVERAGPTCAIVFCCNVLPSESEGKRERVARGEKREREIDRIRQRDRKNSLLLCKHLCVFFPLQYISLPFERSLSHPSLSHPHTLFLPMGWLRLVGS